MSSNTTQVTRASWTRSVNGTDVSSERYCTLPWVGCGFVVQERCPRDGRVEALDPEPGPTNFGTFTQTPMAPF